MGLVLIVWVGPKVNGMDLGSGFKYVGLCWAWTYGFGLRV